MAVKIHCIEKPRLSGNFFRISSEDGKTADRLLQGQWWQAIAQDESEVDWKNYDFVVQFGDFSQDVTRHVKLEPNEFYNY